MINRTDPNLESLELMAHSLEPLLEELVLVGGTVVGLLITDMARPPVRYTQDVDLLTEAAPLSNYYKFCERLLGLGFQMDQDGPVCRWKRGLLLIDLMPTDDSLGFGNRWYEQAAQTSQSVKLPSGLVVRHISAPLFIATKIEAFYGRGDGDFLRSHDVEDIINVTDGRSELAVEVANASDGVRTYIREEIDDLLAQEAFVEAVYGHFRPDAVEQERVPMVLERLRKLAGL